MLLPIKGFRMRLKLIKDLQFDKFALWRERGEPQEMLLSAHLIADLGI